MAMHHDIPATRAGPSMYAFSWNGGMGEVDRKKKELDPLVNAAFVDELPPLERRFATVHSHSLNGSTKEGR